MVKASYVIILICAVVLGPGARKSWGGPQDNATGIDPEAAKIIKALGEHRRAVPAIKVKVLDTMDEIQESGQMVQYGHVRSAVINMPGRLWLESKGDRANTTLWKDDARFTVLDRDQNAYVQLDAPGTIEQSIDMAYEKYGISTPLADLLSSDIYAVLMSRVKTCRYLGLHLVGETACHHIAATQDDIDWQVWIEQGDAPKIRKIVIVYKQEPGSPRYSAVLADYELLDKAPESTFTFQLPKGAEKIAPVPREKEMKPRLKKAGGGE